MTEDRFKLVGGIELPPFRSVNDFLLGKGRYELPNYKVMSNWQNRIIANLLYYQTNYFTAFFAFFVLESCFVAKDIVLGLMAVVISSLTLLASFTSDPYYSQIRKDHIYFFGVIVLVAIQVFLLLFSSILVVIFCILFPIFLILCHASLRLRCTLSKITHTAEKMGLRTTVMGKILDICGLEVKF